MGLEDFLFELATDQAERQSGIISRLKRDVSRLAMRLLALVQDGVPRLVRLTESLSGWLWVLVLMALSTAAAWHLRALYLSHSLGFQAKGLTEHGLSLWEIGLGVVALIGPLALINQVVAKFMPPSSPLSPDERDA